MTLRCAHPLVCVRVRNGATAVVPNGSLTFKHQSKHESNLQSHTCTKPVLNTPSLAAGETISALQDRFHVLGVPPAW